MIKSINVQAPFILGPGGQTALVRQTSTSGETGSHRSVSSCFCLDPDKDETDRTLKECSAWDRAHLREYRQPGLVLHVLDPQTQHPTQYPTILTTQT